LGAIIRVVRASNVAERERGEKYKISSVLFMGARRCGCRREVNLVCSMEMTRVRPKKREGRKKQRKRVRVCVCV
jgi:hypothetical protein